MEDQKSFRDIMSLFIDKIENGFFNNLVPEKFNEFELIYKNCPIEILSNIYRLKKINTSSFIEFVLMEKQENSKLRYRQPVETLKGLDIKNIQLITLLDKVLWEKKILISEDLIDNNFILRHSTEEKILFLNYQEYKQHIILKLVNLISVVDKHFMLDFKISYYLGKAHQGICGIQSALSDIKVIPSISFEIEFRYNKNEKIDFKKLKDGIDNLSKIIFRKNAENVIFSFPHRFKTLRTNTIKNKELYDLDTRNMYLTDKIDGVPVTIHIIEKSLYMIKQYFPVVKYDINTDEFNGYHLLCEYYKDSGVVSLYVIKIFNPEFETRLEEFDFVDTKLSKIKFLNKDIKICTKENVEIEDNNSLINYLINYTPIVNCSTDGIILFQNKNSKDLIDLKYKRENSIDVLATIPARYLSSEPFIEINGVYKIELLLHTPQTRNLKSIYISMEDNIIEYLQSIFCFKFKNFNESKGTDFFIVPIKFICELMNPDSSKIIPRLEKTSKLIYEKYIGNTQYVVDVLYYNHNNPLTLDVDELRLKEKDDEENVNILNKNINYFSQTRKRVNFGIISNYIKTELISNYCSKTYRQKKIKKTVLGIDFGNGGDLTKYFYAEIKLLVASDPDERAIKTALERYKQLNTNIKTKYFPFYYIKKSIRENDYVTNITEHGVTKTFDIIDWQFAIHFSFSEIYIPIVMNNIKQLTHNGSIVLITTTNGEELRKILPKTFKFDEDDDNFIKFEDGGINKINVTAPLIMNGVMTEYEIVPNQVINKFKEYGFDLIDYGTFKNVIDNNKEFIIDLPNLEKRQSTSSFLNLVKSIISKLDGTDVEELLKYYIFFVFIRN